eukprot:scaffold23035_cov153-Skeletonema_marinoi.AAC.4
MWPWHHLQLPLLLHNSPMLHSGTDQPAQRQSALLSIDPGSPSAAHGIDVSTWGVFFRTGNSYHLFFKSTLHLS